MRFRFRINFRAFIACVFIFVAVGIIFQFLSLLDKRLHPKSDIVTLAKQYLGVPYQYGGSTPTGFDCSGYISFVFHQIGKELPRTADQQATVGIQVNIDDLQPGDIVFFATTDEPTISHSGLYIGDRMFIHASSAAKKIIISNLDEPYWRNSFRGARQVSP